MSYSVKHTNVIPESLTTEYEKWLLPYGVGWPRPAEELGLALLYKHLGQAVSQEDLLEFYSLHGEIYGRQLRHLAGSGWHIASGNVRSTRMHIDETIPSDALKLVSVTSPSPIWIGEKRLTREGRAGASSWGDLLQLYASHGCAVCGQKYKHYDKGHLNPNLPQELSNIVPMCVECNNYAQSKDMHFILHGLVARPCRMK